MVFILFSSVSLFVFPFSHALLSLPASLSSSSSSSLFVLLLYVFVINSRHLPFYFWVRFNLRTGTGTINKPPNSLIFRNYNWHLTLVVACSKQFWHILCSSFDSILISIVLLILIQILTLAPIHSCVHFIIKNNTKYITSKQ